MRPTTTLEVGEIAQTTAGRRPTQRGFDQPQQTVEGVGRAPAVPGMGYALSEKDKDNPDNEVLQGSPDFKVNGNGVDVSMSVSVSKFLYFCRVGIPSPTAFAANQHAFTPVVSVQSTAFGTCALYGRSDALMLRWNARTEASREG